MTRKGVTMLLAFWLNLALLPCAMAFEAPEKEHDCCPPTIELQQPDCCEVDAATVDKRGAKFESYDDLVVISTFVAWPPQYTAILSQHETQPPDCTDYSPPLHKLFCVYLD